jgi:hypothetical protein
MKVACERDDGLLNIHDETETCEVCKDVDATMIGEPLKADALSVEAERAYYADKMRRMYCPVCGSRQLCPHGLYPDGDFNEPPSNSDQESDDDPIEHDEGCRCAFCMILLADRLRKRLDKATKKAVE